MDDLLNEFLTETAESIDVVDIQLVELEQDPNNKSVLDNIFRLVHTIKGTCGFLGLPRLESVAHASENVLGKFRDGEMKVSPASVTLILESLDRIKEILAGLEQTEEEPAGDDTDIINRLNAIANGETPEAAAPAAPKVEAVKPAPSAPVAVPDLPRNDDISRQLVAEPTLPGDVTLEELEAAWAAAPGPEDEDTVEAGGAETLYARMGGEDAVSVAMHLFHNRLLSDPALKDAYEGVNMRDQKQHATTYLKALLETEDAIHEGGVDLAFGPLINAGIDTEHMANVVGHFRSVMEEISLAPLVIEEAVGRFHELGLGIVAKAAPHRQAAVSQKAVESDGDDTPAARKAGESSVANQSIRVSVNLLEDLMNMVSELVLTRNQLMQILRRSGDSDFTVPLQRLSQCTTELQEGVMKTRMQPIGNAWAKLPRIIRDLQVDLKKKIDLQMLGADTELDRQVLELIKDPLTHMVRNSADHGLESPADRKAAGKPEVGVVRLNAYHEGGHIIIEISDDGRGLNIAKIKEKAIANKVVTPAELADMTDQQIQRFIFHPGFSTAEKVTSVSGRGVGMDVVRSNIEKIGGTVDLKSTEGRGSTFIIKIPLTLAIVSALIVKSNEERFAIPQISVLELVRASNDTEYKIEYINATPVLRLRDRLLPLVNLRDVLQTNSGEGEEEEREDYIVVTQVGGFTYGIVVDQVFDTEEIVVKPVAPLLRDLSIYSGNTILGDGSVIMILDPNGIAAETSDVMSENDHISETEMLNANLTANRETLLVFNAGGKGQHAVPLSLVARLEEIDVDTIETSDGEAVVQYRGKLMPLIKLNDKYDMKETGRQPVLVFSDGKSSMGLAVDNIIDILEDHMNVELMSEVDGIIGTAIIGGKATEIIDVAHYMTEVFGGLGGFQSARNEEAKAKKKSDVLLIDDSPFFLNMLKPLLTAAGYRVTALDNAQDALSLRDKGLDFDVIVSDIEMPDMDGFAFAEQVKKQGNRWEDVPLVALSSRTNDQDFDRGRAVGFNDYVAKLDKEMLLSALDEMLSQREDAA